MKAHEIDYEIIGDDMQAVEIELDPKETVIAEAGAMNWMDDGINFEVKMGDGSNPDQGLMGKIFNAGKRMIGGESLKEPIGYIKKLRGFGIVKRTEDETIIYIGSGQKPTGGYNITVESVRKIEGVTKIEVFEKGPGPDESVTQAITSPYVVIKVFKSVSNIEAINNQGDKFKDINDESSEADYFERKQ